jgi:hypothetical protein
VRRPALLVLALAATACRPAQEPAARAYLFEKGQYQALYGADGHIRRLLYDGNRDRVAEVVVIYTNLAPRRFEVDDDLDGIVDRWEDYRHHGPLERVARARRQPGVPDVWESLDPSGKVTRRELDEDGDGRVDHSEQFVQGRLASVEIDTDRDGRNDRWQTWRGGALAEETIDTDGDGTADRHLVYGAGGVRMETLGRF